MKKLIYLCCLIGSFYFSEAKAIFIQEEINMQAISPYNLNSVYSYTASITDNDTIFLSGNLDSMILSSNLDINLLKNNVYNTNYSYSKINNNNMLLGEERYEGVPIIWTPEGGIYYVYLRDHISNAQSINSVTLVDLNSNNTVAGSYFVKGNRSDTKIFLYRDGKIWGLDDDEVFQKFGPYKSIEPISISDSEAIFGHITFKINDSDDDYDYEHSYFIKDENGFRLVDLSLPCQAEIVGVNNKNQVLIKDYFPYLTMVWDEENGLRVVAEDIEPTSINDRGQILGKSRSEKNFYHQVLIQDGKVTDLTEFLQRERPDLKVFDDVKMNNNGILLAKMIIGRFYDSVLLKINTDE